MLINCDLSANIRETEFEINSDKYGYINADYIITCKEAGDLTVSKDYYEEHGAVDVGDLSQQVEQCNTDIETLKKSVSDGKDLLADAITEKGIQTASDDTFKLMAEKIKQIQSVGYGVYGKVDTTIASNGMVRYIYGTCTIEQEDE